MAYQDAGQGTGGYAFSNAQAITATAASTTAYDVTGAGAGNIPSMIGANGISTALGFDIGAGEGAAVPYVNINLGTCTTVTGTLTFAIQVAADSGTGTAGSYVTIYSGPALTGTAQLYKGAQFTLPVPPLPDGLLGSGKLPRFYQVLYTVGSSISLIASATLNIGASTLRDSTLYGSNFPGGL